MQYCLLFFCLFLTGFAANAQNCADLFFSEYIEGTGNNRALEIYNPSNESLNLSTYVLRRYAKGATAPSETLPLSGSIASGAVFVVVNGQDSLITLPGGGTLPPCIPNLQAYAHFLAPIYPSVLYFEGDDAISLERITPEGYQFVDIFGKIGEKPIPAWSEDFPYNGSGAALTQDKTLIRKPNVKSGIKSNPDLFNALEEWDTLSVDNWSNLGKHTFDGSTLPYCFATDRTENYLTPILPILYPNPSANGGFQVQNAESISLLTILNFTGEKIFEIELENKPVQAFDSINLPAGAYLIRFQLNNGQVLSSRWITR